MSQGHVRVLDGSPKTISIASVSQLKQTLFWIFSQHGQSVTQCITVGHLVLCDIMPKDENGTAQRLYCLLCIRGCQYMYVFVPCAG